MIFASALDDVKGLRFKDPFLRQGKPEMHQPVHQRQNARVKPRHGGQAGATRWLRRVGAGLGFEEAVELFGVESQVRGVFAIQVALRHERG